MNEQKLIADYLNGDEQSLEILIRQYIKPIYSFAHKYAGNAQDAEDITQEVFVKVWRNLKKFDPKKSFKTWIFTIAKNTCIDWRKKKRAAPFSAFDGAEGNNVITDTLADLTPLPNEIFERAGAAQALTSAIKKLSPKYRKVLFLRYNGCFNFREIAESIGESLNTVKSRHRRAIFMLKKTLSEF